MKTMAGDTAARSTFCKEILIYGEKAQELDKLCKLIKKGEKDVLIHRTDRTEDAYRIAFERNLTMIVIMLYFDKSGDASGMKLLHTIKRIEDKAFIPVIVVTKEELSLKHFLGELHCFGILDSEYEEAYALKLISEALKYPSGRMRREFVYFRKSGVIHSVRVSDILYTEHHKNDTLIHTRCGVLETGRCSCRDILLKLEAFDFMVCARGIVVNMASVEKIDIKKHLLYFRETTRPLVYGKSHSGEIQAYLHENIML